MPFQKNCIRKQYLKLWTLSFLLSCNRLWDSEDVLQGFTMLRSGEMMAVLKPPVLKYKINKSEADRKEQCISRGQASVTKLWVKVCGKDNSQKPAVEWIKHFLCTHWVVWYNQSIDAVILIYIWPLFCSLKSKSPGLSFKCVNSVKWEKLTNERVLLSCTFLFCSFSQ